MILHHFLPNSLLDNDLLPVPLRKQKRPEDILYKPQPYPAIHMIMYQYYYSTVLELKVQSYYTQIINRDHKHRHHRGLTRNAEFQALPHAYRTIICIVTPSDTYTEWSLVPSQLIFSGTSLYQSPFLASSDSFLSARQFLYTFKIINFPS